MTAAGRLLKALVFAALTVACMAAFMHIFAPKPHPPEGSPFSDYDRQPVIRAMDSAAVLRVVNDITAFGSRFLGQPGYFQTEDYIRQKFQAAGLEIFEHEQETLAPMTVRRELLGADGQPLPGVEIYPLFPNHFQPMITPAGGLTGELVLMTDEVLRDRADFTNCIGVVDIMSPPEVYGLNWQRYAQLGVQAVIVTHREGFASLTKSQWAGLVPSLVAHDPINYVRLMADEEILDHQGERVTLHVRTEYRAVPNRTVIGVLKSKRPVREALVLTASYDAMSILPDRAPGVLQAYGVAELLQALEGLLPHRDELRRDVVFLCSGTRMMGYAGAARVLAAIGPRLDRETVRRRLVGRQQQNDTRRREVDRLQTLFTAPGFLENAAPSAAGLATLPAAARALFAKQFSYVLNTLVLEASEEMLQAKLWFIQDDPDNLESEAYRGYLAAKKRYDSAFSAAGYNLERLLSVHGPFAREHQVKERMQARLAQLAVFHGARTRQLAQDLALHDLFQRYENAVVLAPELIPAAAGDRESVTFYMGHGVDHRDEGPNINNLLFAAAQRLATEEHSVQYGSYTKDHLNTVGTTVAAIPLGTRYWNNFSYPAFTLVNGNRKESYDSFALPVEQPFMHAAETLQDSLQWLGETVLSLAYGNGEFKEPSKQNVPDFQGSVFVAGVGGSVVPNYPMAGAIVGTKGPGFQYFGHFRHPFLQTDPYGRYELLGTPADFIVPAAGYSPNAGAFGADGRLAYINDEGAGQSMYKSMNLATHSGLRAEVNLVLFRAMPVTILDLVNPQTLKSYAGVDLAQAATLTGFSSYNTFSTGGPITTFIPAEEKFIVKLKAGSADNELVQVTRAVMLNSSAATTNGGLAEIDAPGYLAATHPLLLNVAHETAQSMYELNGKRLAALERHEMADERTVEFQARAGQLLTASEQPQLPGLDATLAARDSATYSILNYPVIRGAIFDAVYGIMFYLFLLVPFVFFFEKLVCGFTDIRHQLTANVVIFLAVFGLLNILHPAFEMIRSSLMILLGFVIFLVSMGVIVLLSGRFRENLEALKRQRAQVSAAQVNTLGVVGTAFALGLNNMHRRKVRTGLTCATLVLITFAMLCFSTLHSNIVDSANAIGKAPYQGILDKPERFYPISDAELFALQVKYGSRFKITPRQMYVGWETWSRELFNPDLTVSRVTAAGETRKVDFDSVLQFGLAEPLAARLPLLTTNGWFTEAEMKRPGALPVMIPDTMARQLGITVAQVNQHPPVVTLNGREFFVKNIFDAEEFANVRDIDGRSLLPFDVTAMTTIRSTGARHWEIIAEEDDPLMSPQHVVLAPARDLGISVPNGFLRLVSVVISLPDLPYREAKEVISQYLEQTGKPTYYGLDGIAYLGKRFRETSFVGLLDLLIPLFIAALTVLNTIRGSVYERRDEIFVYNAVGIAPRYVFFMFMAEALVYSVVGTVLGYLLAQGTGSLLTALDMTGGLQMNFTSKITVYVSVTIILATLVSTYFPARSALEIAAPAEESGWKLPEPAGDTLSFALPFTFNHHDRIAILAFFHRYFLDHGEGSAARFFAGPPQLGVSERGDPLPPDSYIPEVRTTIWLKPYDLGVSQELTIELPTDPETREYIARITLERLSGTREAWLRLNHSFVSQIRRHFLHWRAVGEEERAELFTEARRLLEANAEETVGAV